LVESAESANALVVLPTGAGKTLVAAELAMRVTGRTVFFVPTCLLVEQQAAAIRAWTRRRVSEYMGGKALECDCDVLVTTPKAFEVAQRTNAGLAWCSFGLVVFDEVHHVLKKSPYRKLAFGLTRSGATPRVLGLTASLTYATGRKQVEAAVNRLCKELSICYLGTSEENELRAGGYHGGGDAVTPTLELYESHAAGLVPEADRKPHQMKQALLSRIQAGTATQFARDLHSCIAELERVARTTNPVFASPIAGRPVTAWGGYAHGLSMRGCVACAELEHWYEALRLLVTSWEEAEDAATTLLRIHGVHNDGADLTRWRQSDGAAQAACARLWERAPATFPRFDHLLRVLAEKTGTIKDFRGLVFVQQRVMTHILAHVIDGASLPMALTPACIYATSAPATPSLAVTRAEAKVRLAAFAAGDVKLLITTSVCEEGMDVPAANCIVSFDSMDHAVSYVQRRGRARQVDSCFIVLCQRADRPVAVLADIERMQLDIIRSMDLCLDDTNDASQRQSQESRERNAAVWLCSQDEPTLATARAALHTFCTKTRVELVETETTVGQVEFTYESCLRRVSGKSAAAGSKKVKKKEASLSLAQGLRVALNGGGGSKASNE
jgi:ERCC4-related helicase